MPKFVKQRDIRRAEQFLGDDKPLPFRDLSAMKFDGTNWYTMTTIVTPNITTQEPFPQIVEVGDWLIEERGDLWFNAFEVVKHERFTEIYLAYES